MEKEPLDGERASWWRESLLVEKEPLDGERASWWRERESVPPHSDALQRCLSDALQRCLSDALAMCITPRSQECALDVISMKAVLDAPSCKVLRDAVDEKRSCYPDSVDRMPEHQLDLQRDELEKLIGVDAVAGLWRLPRRLFSQRESGIPGECSDEAEGSNCYVTPEPTYHVEIFVRRYSRSTRPLIGFHRDACAVTVNVALSDDDAHTGGRLLAVLNDGVHVLGRQAGEATVHPSSVLHAVSAMEGGTRYSLLLFFYHPASSAADVMWARRQRH